MRYQEYNRCCRRCHLFSRLIHIHFIALPCLIAFSIHTRPETHRANTAEPNAAEQSREKEKEIVISNDCIDKWNCKW